MSKKKLIPVIVVLVLGLGAAYSMAKPKKIVKLKVQGTIYVLPESFLLNLSEGHYAKLTIALDLAPTQSDGGTTAGANTASAGESAGTLPEEPLVREIVTDTITGQSGSSLVSTSGRNAIKHQILTTIRTRTDLKVESVLLPEVTVQ
jgi:flagellar basal body-associated protein FliL